MNVNPSAEIDIDLNHLQYSQNQIISANIISNWP